MNISPKDIIPISELVHGANKVINRLKKSKKPLVVTQNGKAAMICMEINEYEKQFYRNYVLQSIEEAEKDLKKGNHLTLDEFEEELGRM